MKIVITAALLTLSTYSLAETGSLTIESTPDPMHMYSDGGISFSLHNIKTWTQIPFGKAAKITSINWRTTYFPDYTHDNISLCYRPSIQIEDCKVVTPNSSGSISDFTHTSFNRHSNVIIRHNVSLGKQLGRPAGSNSVTINYEY